MCDYPVKVPAFSHHDAGDACLTTQLVTRAAPADRPAYIAAWANVYASMNLTSLFYPVSNVETRPIDMTEPNCVGPKGDVINCGETWLCGDDAKAAQTVLALPLGLSTGGLPVAGNFAGPLGADAEILSLGLALEKLLGRLPGPAEPSGCLGCTAMVTNQTVSLPCTSDWSMHLGEQRMPGKSMFSS